MRQIVVTGKNGYVANAIKRWFGQNEPETAVFLLDVRTEEWKQQSFREVDAIIHTAAMVHKKESEHTLEEYQQVNVELTRALAEKAKAEGVGQFIFLSTMAVYGVEASCFRKVEITSATPTAPKSKYGITKLAAERVLQELKSEAFKVTILRPPMIYGPGCPGNYQSLRRLTLKLGILPRIKNQRSMLYVDFLCEMTAELLRQRADGIYCPQNPESVCTTELAAEIAKCNGRRVFRSLLAGLAVRLASLGLPVLRKAFGSECYGADSEQRNAELMQRAEKQPQYYGKMTLEETIRETEKHHNTEKERSV